MKACRLALVLTAALALASARALAEADAPAAHVLRVSGAVEVSTLGGVWRPAQAGLALVAGSSLRTGDTGRAEVSLASGTVRVYENSLLRVPGVEDGTERVQLRKGAGLFDVTLPKGRQFRVETPEAVAAVKGTRFLVEAARGAVSAGVFEGIVELRKLGEGAAPPVLVREGFGATLGDGAFELMVLERPDPWHEWESGGAAPALIPPSPPAAQDEAVRDAVLEATDAVLETELRADDPKGDESAPADQDDGSGALEMLEDSIGEYDREPAGDITSGSELERPAKTERIDADNSGPGSTSSGPSSN